MRESLLFYTLHLADTPLVLGHRLSEWTGHGPMLEQDIALTNIALDLIGQSRNFYQYAARVYASLPEGAPWRALFTGSQSGTVTEDTFAYLRDTGEFRNLLIAELPNGDWAQTLLKLFFVSSFQYLLYQKLEQSGDQQLAAIAEKSLKEVSYHKRWSREWVLRMGDGTEESHRRMESALSYLWPYTNELFLKSPYETQEAALSVAPAVDELQDPWLQEVQKTFREATLDFQGTGTWGQQGGKTGTHSEHLGYLLAEMQFLQRAYPGQQW